MKAKYIIRLDDACDTMDRSKWQKIEEILDFYEIKPIVAVIPECKDVELVYDEINHYFWDKIRSWQSKGWTIAMHGYQHILHDTDAKMLIPFYKRSEFAGLSYKEQEYKIQKSLAIFKSQNVNPEVWIAPAHTFDLHTLRALKKLSSIEIVSDGIARDQYYENDFYWIPQQLWNFRKKNSGLWTVCFHPSTMNEENITSFVKDISKKYVNNIISLNDLNLIRRNKSLIDIYTIYIFWVNHWKNNLIKNIKVLLNEFK